jgi:hypothetical protein
VRQGPVRDASDGAPEKHEHFGPGAAHRARGCSQRCRAVRLRPAPQRKKRDQRRDGERERQSHTPRGADERTRALGEAREPQEEHDGRRPGRRPQQLGRPHERGTAAREHQARERAGRQHPAFGQARALCDGVHSGTPAMPEEDADGDGNTGRESHAHHGEAPALSSGERRRGGCSGEHTFPQRNGSVHRVSPCCSREMLRG